MADNVYWAGDSTVKSNNITTYPQTGIGQAMDLYFHKEVMVYNHAENGRSTKSFIDEQRLAKIYNALRPGDFLFIQFGHNDGKIDDATRHTEPYGDYQENLHKFVNVARNRRAYPVLITPICRRWFSDGIHLDEAIHGDYPEAMIELGERLSVPVIDLYQSSRKRIESLGPEGSEGYFVARDNTHLVYEGAVTFAGLIANGLEELGGIYKKLLI